MKKRLMCFVICLALIVCLSACGGNEDSANSSPENDITETNSPVAEDAFSAKDVSLTIGGIIKKGDLDPLGTPADIQTAPSCHYDGNDTIYIYEGLTIYTYADKSDEVVYLIEITDASYSAHKATKVGMSVDEIKSIMGEPVSETAIAVIYDISDDTTLRYSVSDSVVTMIEYEENI